MDNYIQDPFFAMLVPFDEIYMFFLSHGSHNKAPIAH